MDRARERIERVRGPADRDLERLVVLVATDFAALHAWHGLQEMDPDTYSVSVDAAHLVLVGAAACVGGAVNAIAGGGSLITFPALLACHIPAVTASVTNTIAMCPGYFGATVAQRRELAGQGARIAWVAPAGALGGVAGALLLLHTGEAAFDVVVPFLLVFAVALIAFQDRLRTFVAAHTKAVHSAVPAILVGIAAIYGGYFGAGLGVIVLASLAVVIDDSLIRINALKQTVSLAVNVAAAIVFVAIARVDLGIVLVMAVCSLAGGVVGGAIASRVSARLLRMLVILFGLAVAAVYFAKLLAHL